MKILISHELDVDRHRIDVKVSGEAAEAIFDVEVSMDGALVVSEYLSPPQPEFVRSLRHIGTLRVGMEHIIAVTSTNESGAAAMARISWTD